MLDVLSTKQNNIPMVVFKIIAFDLILVRHCRVNCITFTKHHVGDLLETRYMQLDINAKNTLICDVLCDFGPCGDSTSTSQNRIECFMYSYVMKLHATSIGFLSYWVTSFKTLYNKKHKAFLQEF